jgi:hypothetical protein
MELCREVSKKFFEEICAAESTGEEVTVFGFEYNPDEERYNFKASIEVHVTKELGQIEGTALVRKLTFLHVYGVLKDGSLKFLYKLRARL